jgi:hypothetical protein
VASAGKDNTKRHGAEDGQKKKETQMNKYLLALALLASLSTETFAQHAGSDQDRRLASTMLSSSAASGWIKAI